MVGEEDSIAHWMKGALESKEVVRLEYSGNSPYLPKASDHNVTYISKNLEEDIQFLINQILPQLPANSSLSYGRKGCTANQKRSFN